MKKKILKQVVTYGFSSVIVKLFPFIISPFISQRFGPMEIAPFVDLYSISGIIIVLLTHGMETSFFRFTQKDISREKLISTSSVSVIIISILFFILAFFFRKNIADILKIPEQIQYLLIIILILSIDGVCTMPFTILRQEGKSRKYALVKTVNAFTNFLFIFIFIVFIPKYYPSIYNSKIGIGYVFISNLIASFISLLLLLNEFKKINLSKFDVRLWRDLMLYSIPITIAGLSGIINETIDRQFLKFILPEKDNIIQMSIYGTVYKIVTFIVIFRQAYILGIEPFFFSYSKNKNAKLMYSKLMTWFVTINCIIFLGICVNLNFIASVYIRNSEYYEGLYVVPILLIASMFLGIYLNLSIWYKLCDKTKFGAYISILGAIVTIIINVIFIPIFGFLASAWATFFSYLIMMIVSYLFGRKYYPVPYNIKICSLYVSIASSLSYLSYFILDGNMVTGNILFLLFLIFFIVERRVFLYFNPLLKDFF